MLIEWREALKGIPAVVKYDNPQFYRGTPPIQMDLALIALPNEGHIDVSWDDEENLYVVQVFRDRFESSVLCREFRTAEDAQRFAASLAARSINATQVVHCDVSAVVAALRRPLSHSAATPLNDEGVSAWRGMGIAISMPEIQVVGSARIQHTSEAASTLSHFVYS